MSTIMDFFESGNALMKPAFHFLLGGLVGLLEQQVTRQELGTYGVSVGCNSWLSSHFQLTLRLATVQVFFSFACCMEVRVLTACSAVDGGPATEMPALRVLPL